MEENRAEQLFFLWEKISEGEIRLLRVFGEQPGRDSAGIYRWKMRAGTGRLLLFKKKASGE